MNRYVRQVEVPVQQGVGEEKELDLRFYLYVVYRFKWAILGIGILVAVFAALKVYSIQPSYLATATILIESQEENIVSIEEVYGIPGANAAYFETQNRILQSRDLAERVIDRLGLMTHREFDPTIAHESFSFNPLTWIPKDWLGSSEKPAPPNPQDLRNAVVGNFMSRLSVTPVRNSQLINISFESTDRELAYKVPNELADAFIDADLESRLGMTERATGWITARLEELKANMETSENALQEFRDQQQLVDVQGVDSLAAKELDKLTSELVSARRELSEAEELRRQVNALSGQSIEAYASIPAVLADSNVQGTRQVLAEASKRVSELGKRYGPKHPRMIAAQVELDAANRNLESAVKNVIDSVPKQYQLAQARERELSRSMDRTRSSVVDINRMGSTLKTLEREVESNRQLYDMFLDRYKETNAAGDLKTANARVVDPAVMPSWPFKPNRRKTVLIALFLGLCGGTLLAFLLESLDNTLKNTADVEQKLGVPVLSILPKVPVKKDAAEELLHYFSEHSDTKFSENIRTIRTSLLLSDIDESKKSILVTSSVPSEGKSTVAVNLALSLGQIGKVLLIDADLRRPSIASAYNLNKSGVEGLTHFIANTESLNQCIHHFIKSNLYVMPAGIVPPNPLELLSSKRFQAGMEKIIKAFDYVVIDSAPITAVSDSIVLSQYVNSVAYVVKADDTPYQVVNDGIKRLRQGGGNLVGVILNQVSPPKAAGRYGYYGGDYHKYYGYDKPK